MIQMSKVGSNIVLGTLWITAGIGMYLTGNGDNEIGAAILVVLGMMFYWAAFKIFKDPRLGKKNNKKHRRTVAFPVRRQVFILFAER